MIIDYIRIFFYMWQYFWPHAVVVIMWDNTLCDFSRPGYIFHQLLLLYLFVVCLSSEWFIGVVHVVVVGKIVHHYSFHDQLDRRMWSYWFTFFIKTCNWGSCENNPDLKENISKLITLQKQNLIEYEPIN